MLKAMMTFLCVFSALLLSSCTTLGTRAYDIADEAYHCGQYQTAFANYLYAANRGVVPAQYAVGYMYYYGLGTKSDEAKSILWFQRAAPNSVRAQYALHLIQEHRPPQPWTYQLKEYKQHNACVIHVHCEQ